VLELTPRARLVRSALVGSDPVLMLTGPIPATEKVLADTGLKIDSRGGNGAFGHPLGASVLLTPRAEPPGAHRGPLRSGQHCCGGGLGTATVLERL
jgi:acetyl-CoA C-acetyltransferase